MRIQAVYGYAVYYGQNVRWAIRAWIMLVTRCQIRGHSPKMGLRGRCMYCGRLKAR